MKFITYTCNDQFIFEQMTMDENSSVDDLIQASVLIL